MVLRLDQSKEGPRVDSSESRRSSRLRIQVPVFSGLGRFGCGVYRAHQDAQYQRYRSLYHFSPSPSPRQTVHLTIPAPSLASSSLIPSETPPIVAKVRRLDHLGELRLFGLEFLHPLE